MREVIITDCHSCPINYDGMCCSLDQKEVDKNFTTDVDLTDFQVGTPESCPLVGEGVLFKIKENI